MKRAEGDAADVVLWRRLILTPAMEYAERDAVIAREVGSLMLSLERSDATFWSDVILCGVEYPFTSPKIIATVVLKTILGAIVATIPEHVHVLAMPARLWTPWFLRERTSDPLPTVPRKSADRKPLIKAHALRLLGSDDIFPQDAYDAFGIAVAVERYNDVGLANLLAPAKPAPRAVRAR